MSEVTKKPDCVTDAHLQYLDELRDSGETNMFGARSYLMDQFNIGHGEAKTILSYWMETFSARMQLQADAKNESEATQHASKKRGSRKTSNRSTTTKDGQDQAENQPE